LYQKESDFVEANFFILEEPRLPQTAVQLI